MATEQKVAGYAADTSSLVSYLNGDKGEDVEMLSRLISLQQLYLPHVVLTELVSDPKLPAELIDILCKLPTPPLAEGFWLRAGISRSSILKRKLKARVADALIGQSCLDNDLCLITRDQDFRHWEAIHKLRVIWGP